MESTYTADRHEAKILMLLQKEARLSHAEIGRRIGLSATAVADRIRDLELAGVIDGYVAVVNTQRLGRPIVAMVTMTCDGERCRLLPQNVEPMPEVVECHRLTGDASALLKVVVASIQQLEEVVDRLATFGKPSTSIVLSTAFHHRPIPFDGVA